MKTTLTGIALFMALSLLDAANLAAQTETSPLTFNVQIRSGVTVNMGATVLSRQQGSKRDGLLIVGQASQTAATFATLAESILASDAKVSSVTLLDFPGHGTSGLPSGGGVKLGDLTLDDYASAFLASLAALDGLQVKITAIVGHGLGGEIVQLAQTKLLQSGRSLRRDFHIRAAVFIVPTIGAPLQWAAIDAGAADGLAAVFIRNDPSLGTVYDLLTHVTGPTTWVALYYANNAATVAPGAPTPAQAVSNGWIAVESGLAFKELIGLPNTPGGPRLPRPAIGMNTFTKSSGTIAAVVALEQDALYFFPDEHKALYEYLTGDPDDTLFFTVTGPFTVENIHTITPLSYNALIQTVLDASRN